MGKIHKDDNDIYYIGDYYPYWLAPGYRNPNFDSFSGKILDVKENQDRGINYFTPKLSKIFEGIHNSFTICIVPSHDPRDQKKSGILTIAKKLMNENRLDGTMCLRRSKKIDKLATGGNRSISVHLNSITLHDTHLITGNNVIIFDDVTTSGNSMLACKMIIERANPAGVIMFALSKKIG